MMYRRPEEIAWPPCRILPPKHTMPPASAFKAMGEYGWSSAASLFRMDSKYVPPPSYSSESLRAIVKLKEDSSWCVARLAWPVDSYLTMKASWTRMQSALGISSGNRLASIGKSTVSSFSLNHSSNTGTSLIAMSVVGAEAWRAVVQPPVDAAWSSAAWMAQAHSSLGMMGVLHTCTRLPPTDRSNCASCLSLSGPHPGSGAGTSYD
mmetsp:Transcript_6117/g.17876  ORF Transcript_6117/g.17876 Transcript_6117/m.17876 type:complete len:207 (-) Transcript_6117:273-893(-)